MFHFYFCRSKTTTSIARIHYQYKPLSALTKSSLHIREAPQSRTRGLLLRYKISLPIIAQHDLKLPVPAGGLRLPRRIHRSHILRNKKVKSSLVIPRPFSRKHLSQHHQLNVNRKNCHHYPSQTDSSKLKV